MKRSLSVLLALLLALMLCLSFAACGDPPPQGGETEPPGVTDPGGGTEDPPEEEVPDPQPEDKRVEAIADNTFQDGFGVMGLNSATDGTSVKTQIKFGRRDPVWRIGQWGSRYNLNEPLQNSVTTQAMILADRSKTVTLDRAENELTLALDATKEYDTSEESRVMWAHLLIEQSFDDFPQYRLSEFDSLVATLDFSVTKAEKGAIETGDAADTLPAQFLQYFYVVNRNESSPGYSSFLWFGLSYLDTRYDSAPLSYLQDTAGGNLGNYIYSLGAESTLGPGAFEVGREYSVEIDILPYISAALQTAAENGFMLNTQLSDCVITGMNLGWEVPGAWDVSATIGNLSLKGSLKNQQEENL